jgi:hypothetical protein
LAGAAFLAGAALGAGAAFLAGAFFAVAIVVGPCVDESCTSRNRYAGRCES